MNTQTVTLCLKPRSQQPQPQQQPQQQPQRNGRSRTWTKTKKLSTEERNYLKSTVGFADVDEIPDKVFDRIMLHATTAANSAEASLRAAARFLPSELQTIADAVNSDLPELKIEMAISQIITASKARVNILHNQLKKALADSAKKVNQNTEAFATSGKLQQGAAAGTLKTTAAKAGAPSMRLGALGRSLASTTAPQGYRLGGDAVSSSLV